MDLQTVDVKPTISVPKELDLPQESFSLTLPNRLTETKPLQNSNLSHKTKAGSTAQLINSQKSRPERNSRQGANSKRKQSKKSEQDLSESESSSELSGSENS